MLELIYMLEYVYIVGHMLEAAEDSGVIDLGGLKNKSLVRFGYSDRCLWIGGIFVLALDMEAEY